MEAGRGTKGIQEKGRCVRVIAAPITALCRRRLSGCLSLFSVCYYCCGFSPAVNAATFCRLRLWRTIRRCCTLLAQRISRPAVVRFGGKYFRLRGSASSAGRDGVSARRATETGALFRRVDSDHRHAVLPPDLRAPRHQSFSGTALSD